MRYRRFFCDMRKEEKMRHRCRCAGIVLAAVLLTGCGMSAEVEDLATNRGYEQASGGRAAGTELTASGEQTGLQDDGKETGGIPKEEIKVGVLHISDPAEGSGYAYTHDLGIQGMQVNLGLSEDQVIRKIVPDNGDTQAVKDGIQECIDEGCNVIFTTSWGYMEPTAEMAEQYPELYFSHGTGYLSNGENFNNYFGRIYQARYLSGLVAGMKTETDKIGYVAAMDASNSEVTGGIDAFAIGVHEVNPDAVIYVKVTNSWYDPEAEAAASGQLLDLGCDVMAQHCDTPYPQTMAQERGVYGVGYNSDMSKETPESCLCSVVWNWSAYYTQAVQSIIDGSWDGSNYFGGLSDGLVDITDLADFCAEGTQEVVDAAKKRILTEGFNVFDGVLITNTGETTGTEGGTLDDATITGGIDWYFQNVVVVE